MKTYAIGDVHGCLPLLEEALAWIEQDAGDAPANVVTLGDYVDRGTNSKGVIERLMKGMQNPNHTMVSLAGNHDQMMLMAAKGDRGYAEVWMMNGGRETLESYRLNVPSPYEARISDFVDAALQLPTSHVKWL